MIPTLVRATAAQAPVLRKLFCDVVGPLTLYDRAARDFELGLYTEQRFAEIVCEDADAIWLACVDGAPVGFSVVEPDRDLWWFSWIGVTERGRGQRLGHLLVDNALQIARARRIRKISCVVRPQNATAISLLQGFGFEKVCDLKDHWFGEDYLLWQIKP
jgi:ribosomal protein S18 acetylase RimI-like enzyme